MAAFAQRLKDLRKEAGLTQAQLSERSGIHRVMIARLETGVNEPAWSTVRVLAKALGVTTEAFNVEEEPATEEPPAGKPKGKRKGDAE